MRAAILTTFGSPLTVDDVPDPEAGGGEVLATCVPPYAAEVFSGARRYPLEPPVVPGVGGIGRVARVGPDATKLRAGAPRTTRRSQFNPGRALSRLVLQG